MNKKQWVTLYKTVGCTIGVKQINQHFCRNMHTKRLINISCKATLMIMQKKTATNTQAVWHYNAIES